MSLLAERFDPHRNNLAVQRLLLASAVLVVHGQALSQGRQPSVFRADLGELAVDGFFVLSGFLVTGSAVRLGSVRRFVWHRWLRIMPGFWVCLLVTGFVAGPLLARAEGRDLGEALVGPESARHYVLSNAALLIRQKGISNLPSNGFIEGTMNGSLWSLYYEGMCYLAVAGLMLLGVLAVRRGRAGRHGAAPGRRAQVPGRWFPAVVTGVLWATLAGDLAGAGLPMNLGRRMLFTFMIGVLAQLYADRVPMNGRLALLALLLTVGSCALLYEYRLVGGVPFAYVMIWLAVAAPVVPQPAFDLSYGVYMYHWPIFSLLVTHGLGAHGLPLLLICGAGLTVGVAMLSWCWIEAPALAFKSARWVERPALRRRLQRPFGFRALDSAGERPST